MSLSFSVALALGITLVFIALVLAAFLEPWWGGPVQAWWVDVVVSIPFFLGIALTVVSLFAYLWMWAL